MASTYPTSLDSFVTSRADDGTVIIHASHVTDNADAINKIEAELGTLPKGGAADVKTRIANTETVANAAVPKSTVTTNGDTIYGTGSSAVTRLAVGSTDQVLTVAGGVPTWAAGSKKTLTTTGDILYASGAQTLARRGIGNSGDVLTVSGGLPTWAAPTSSKTVTGIIPAAGTTATAGTGFTYTHTNGTGVYVFTFSVAYAATPVVVATINENVAVDIAVYSVSTTGFSVSTVGGAQDRAFNFLAYTVT